VEGIQASEPFRNAVDASVTAKAEALRGKVAAVNRFRHTGTDPCDIAQRMQHARHPGLTLLLDLQNLSFFETLAQHSTIENRAELFGASARCIGSRGRIGTVLAHLLVGDLLQTGSYGPRSLVDIACRLDFHRLLAGGEGALRGWSGGRGRRDHDCCKPRRGGEQRAPEYEVDTLSRRDAFSC
jgi:hypothetical protein